MDTSIYEPSEWGKEYHSCTVQYLLGAGSAGPGKTTVLRAEPLEQVSIEHDRCSNPQHPYHIPWGSSVGWALFMRRTQPRQLQNISLATRLYKAVDPGVNYNAQNHLFTFSSGYKVQFGACVESNDWLQFMSAEYTLIMFDELVEFEEEQFEQITGRLRSTDPVLKYMLKVRCMSNPVQIARSSQASQDPYWVRRRFVDYAPQGRVVLRKVIKLKSGQTREITSMYLPATLYDNPDKEFVTQYETTLRGKPLHIQKALLFGDWYVSAGSYYAYAWNPEYHVCEPFKIPDTWPRFRAMDWGFKTQGCIGWFAIDPEGNLFVEREFNFQLMDAQTVAENVKRIETQMGLWKGNRSGITGPADTQLWEERGDGGLTKIAIFVRYGINWTQADKSKGSRARHAERLTARLVDHRDGTATAGIVFFNTCKKCIQTIPAMQTDPNDMESVLKGGDDHWHDMVCYAVSYASHGKVGRSLDDVHIRYIRDNDPADDDDDLESPRGATGYGI